MASDGPRTSRRRTSPSRAATAGKTTARRKSSARTKSGPHPKRIPRHRKPEGMSVAEWQVALRRQFGREQDFQVKNVGGAEAETPEAELSFLSSGVAAMG